jgi:predicted  nucleic acid-binding Zn-ribbon protein
LHGWIPRTKKKTKNDGATDLTEPRCKGCAVTIGRCLARSVAQALAWLDPPHKKENEERRGNRFDRA